MKTLKSPPAAVLSCSLALFVACCLAASVPSLSREPATDTSSFRQSREAVVNEALASARALYRQANFEKALLYLDRAERLSPQSPQIEALRRACAAKAERRHQLLAQSPQDPASLKRYIDGKYDEAEKMFNRRDGKQAAETFETVWLLAGDYRDTVPYLNRLGAFVVSHDSGVRDARVPPPAQTIVAQGAEPAPAPASAPSGVEARPAVPPAVTPAATPAVDPKEEARKQAREQQQQIEQYLAQGKQLLEAQQWDRARQAAEKALQIDSGNRSAIRLLNRIEQTRQEVAEREKAAAVSQALQLARTHLRDERFDAAAEAYRGVLAIDSANSYAQKGLAEIERARQEKAQRELEEQARSRAAERAAKIAGDLDFARAQAKAQQYDKAIETYQAILRTDPENRAAHKGLQQAQAALQSAQQEQALRQQEAEEQRRREQIESRLATAREQERAANFEQARATFVDVLRDDPDNWAAQRGLSRVIKQTERLRAQEEAAQTKSLEAQNRAEEEDRQAQERQIAQEQKAEEEARRAREREIAREQARMDAAQRPSLLDRVTGWLPRRTREQPETSAEEKSAPPLAREIPAPSTPVVAPAAVQVSAPEPVVPVAPAPAPTPSVSQPAESHPAPAPAAVPVEKPVETAVKPTAEVAPTTSRPPAPVAAEPASLPPTVVTVPPQPVVVAAAEQEQEKQVKATSARLTQEARVLLAQGKVDEAEKKVREALTLDPNNGDAKILVSEVEAARQRHALREARGQVNNAKEMIKKGQYAQAVEALGAILKANPRNQEAKELLDGLQKKIEGVKQAEAAKRGQIRRQRVEQLLAEGRDFFKKSDMPNAVARWKEVLTIDPENATAKEYLKETEGEYQAYLKQQEAEKRAAEAAAAAAAKMEEKITVETKEGGVPLSEFLKTLSFITGIDFNIVAGADTLIIAKYEDKRLREVLDNLLPPSGLTWERELDIVTIKPDLKIRVFRIGSDVLLSVQRLIETRQLQQLLWGSDTPPIPDIQLTLDERQSVLMLTDTERNILKLDGFLKEIEKKAPPKLIVRTYTVRSDIAKQVKVLVEAILRTETEPEYEQDRKILLAEVGDAFELVVKDTEENLQKVEELLEDQNFLRRLEEADLQVYSQNLTPRDVLTKNVEQVEAFARDVKEVIEVMLYHKSGVAEARKEGRRLWFDPPTLQLTITDYQDNIRKVSQFIDSLPQMEPKMRSKILFLESALAGDMASQLEQVLGISAAGVAAGVAGGNQASFSLRVEDERTFRDLSIRLVRVDENNFGDENDDSCELVVRTSQAQSSDLNIPEFRSEVFEEYEIMVEEVNPSPTPGEGRVRLQVTYRPEMAGGGAAVLPPEGAAPPPTAAPAAEEVELEITPFEDLNALLIRYRDVAQFEELMRWIEELDVPVLQISVETMFVEVNETIAKQFSADWRIANLGDQSLDLDNSILNMRFAQDQDEVGLGLEPPIKYTQNAGLLKGTTILNLLTGGNSPLQFSLKMLEEEGLLNVVAGPTVTVLNAQTATFEITNPSGGGYGGYGGGGYGGYGGGGYGGGGYGGGGYGGGGYGGGGYGGFGGGGFGGIGGYPGGGGYGGYGGGGYGGGGFGQQALDMEVTPNATRKGQIQLDLSININTPSYDIGQQSTQFQLGQVYTGQPLPYSVTYSATPPSTSYRTLETTARVQDGGTVVLGGWLQERTRDSISGVPVLRRLPYVGRLVFGRNSRVSDRTNLLIFLTAKIVE